MMGHSRGGFLSAQAAAAYPERVSAVVNLAGAWSAFCETRNNGYGRDAFKDSAARFKMQYWVYFEKDTYFAPDRFNDPDYEWFAATARQAGIEFRKYSNGNQADGHITPYFHPEFWSNDVFGWLRKAQGGNTP